MRPVEFWLLAILCAVMHISASGTSALVLACVAYGAALCALWASFKAFQREQMAR